MTKASENEFPKITMAEGSAPGTPTSGLGFIYAKTDGKLYFKNDAGTETDLSSGSGLADQGAFTYLDATEGAAPGTPTSGYVRIYAKTDGRVYSMDDGGVEYGPFDEAGTGTGELPVVGTNFCRWPWTALCYGAEGNTLTLSANASDGSSATYAASTTATVPHSTIWDLSEPRRISRAEIIFRDAGHTAVDGTLDYGDNGSDWTNAETWADDTSTTRAYTFTAVDARYWRLRATETGAPGSQGMDVTELRLIYADEDGSAIDHASGLTPTSNETMTNITYATDGYESTVAVATSAETNAYLRVDLGTAQVISGCLLVWDDSGHSVGHGKLQYSSNDSDWSDAYEYEIGNASLYRLHALPTPTSARYWRHYTVAKVSHANGCEYQEFQLWG